MYKVTLNDQKVYNVEIDGKTIRINDKSISPDKLIIENNFIHVLYKGKSYSIIVDKYSEDHKQVELTINGIRNYLVVQNDLDIVLENTGLNKNSALSLKSLNAPMPGKVTKIHVKASQTVKPDTPLLILNAMKMENILKSKSENVVAKILVKEGENVEKGQELIQFE